MKKILLILVLFGFGLTAFSQEKTKKELKGDKYYFLYDYQKAIDYYTETEELTEDGMRKLADSYQKMNRDAEAEQTYARLVNKTNGREPEDYYSYAAILRTNGKYDESNIWMENFRNLRPNDLRAQSFEKHRNDLGMLMSDAGKYKVINQEVNSNDQDFGTAFYIDNKVVFTSSRAKPSLIKRKYNWNGKPYLNLYVSEVENGQLKKPKNFSKKLNSKYHDGPASFANNGTFMAYTKNNEKDKSKDKVVELQIHFTSMNDKEKWSKPEPFAYNGDGYSVGHPSLTADGKTMYFASDMPGGFGGTDIYKTTRNGDGSWTKPVNLGSGVNTEGDELFPFIEEQNQILFFASDGHFGLGGLDIFYSPANGGEAVNAGAPLNGRQDDYAMIMNPTTNKGYFSSDRRGGESSDDIFGLDIYTSFKTTVRIAGVAKDDNDNRLAGVSVTLFDEAGKEISSLMNDGLGEFSFTVPAGQSYSLRGKKRGYQDGHKVVSTDGQDSVVYAELVLQKELEEKPIDVDTDLGAMANLNSIYFDFDKYNIRTDAAIELDKIVKIMSEHPVMEVKISSHADCRGTMVYNQYLSDQRARSTLEYIQARISNPGRISGQGFGETKLANGCACEGKQVSVCSEDEHQMNRRTEFIVTKGDNKVSENRNK